MNVGFSSPKKRAPVRLALSFFVVLSVLLLAALAESGRVRTARAAGAAPSYHHSASPGTPPSAPSLASANFQATATPFPTPTPPVLNPPELSSPPNGASPGCYSSTPIDVPLSWVQSDSPDVDGYQVEVVKIGGGSLQSFGVTTDLFRTTKDQPNLVLGDECGDYSIYRWRVRTLGLQDQVSYWSKESAFSVYTYLSLGAGGEVVPVEPNDKALLECSGSETGSVPLHWNASDDPFGKYELEIAPVGAVAGQPIPTISIPDSSVVTYTAALPCGMTYQWRVRAIDPFGAAGPWSKLQTFELSKPSSVNLPPPGLKDPVSGTSFICPASNAREVDLRWDPGVADPATTGYEIEVAKIPLAGIGTQVPPIPSTDSLVVSATATQTTLKIDCTPPDADYFFYRWRMRSVNANGNAGNWSEDHLFTLIPIQKLRPPDPVDPVQDSTFTCSRGRTLNVPLRWNPTDAVESETGYEVEVTRSNASGLVSRPALSSVPLDQNALTLSFDCGFDYHWRIRSLYGKLGDGEWSYMSTFHLVPNAPSPAPPKLDEPKDGAEITCPRNSAMDLLLSWTPNLKPAPAGSPGSRYEIEVQSKEETGTAYSSHIFTENPPQSSVQPSEDCGTSIRWRVRVSTEQGVVGRWSETRTLNLKALGSADDSTPPLAPVSLSPGALGTDSVQKIACDSLKFDWKPVNDASGMIRYNIYLYQFNDQAGIWTRRFFPASFGREGTSASGRLFGDNEGHFMWRVGAVDNAGNESYSPWRFFNCG